MKLDKVNGEVPEKIIFVVKIKKLKIFDFLKTKKSFKNRCRFKIRCYLNFIIFFICFFHLCSAAYSILSDISLREVQLNEEIPFSPQPCLNEKASAELRSFKLLASIGELGDLIFKTDLPEMKEKKRKEIVRTEREEIINFKLSREKDGSLFSMLGIKISDDVEASNKRQEDVKKEEAKDEEIIKPQFKNIKEEISVYAFLGWLWLVIGVLLYILNEQIKEADKRRQLGL